MKKALLLIATCLVAAGCSTPRPSVETFDRALPVPRPGKAIRVETGDTVYSIARRYHVSMRDLIAINHLRAPFQLVEGMPLTLPAQENNGITPTIIEAAPLKAPEAASNTIVRSNEMEPLDLAGTKTYQQVVPVRRATAEVPASAEAMAATQPEERVIYAPVEQSRMDELAKETLAKDNLAKTEPEMVPEKATKLTVKNLAKDLEKQQKTARKQPVPTAADVTRELNLQPLSNKASQELQPAEPAKQAEDIRNEVVRKLKEAPKADAPIAEKLIAEKPAKVDDARFIWPVRGQMLSSFGPKSGGMRNDGINVGAPRGTPVVAADGGVIAYAGSDIPGYGNVVLIRHADGWMTTYAHLERIYVQREGAVKKGDMLGTVGTSGGLSTPQLHFEIRQGSQALDPEGHLSKR